MSAGLLCVLQHHLYLLFSTCRYLVLDFAVEPEVDVRSVGRLLTPVLHRYNHSNYYNTTCFGGASMLPYHFKRWISLSWMYWYLEPILWCRHMNTYKFAHLITWNWDKNTWCYLEPWNRSQIGFYRILTFVEFCTFIWKLAYATLTFGSTSISRTFRHTSNSAS